MTIHPPRVGVALIVGAMVLLAGCGFLGGTNGNTPPGGIGNTNGIPDTPVSMTASGFSPTSVTIRSGQSILFSNSTSSTGTSSTGTPTTGRSPTPLTICMGQDGTCSLDKVGPTSLRWPPGLGVEPGKTAPVRFDTAGTYHVTLEKQSGSNLTVTVTS